MNQLPEKIKFQYFSKKTLSNSWISFFTFVRTIGSNRHFFQCTRKWLALQSIASITRKASRLMTLVCHFLKNFNGWYKVGFYCDVWIASSLDLIKRINELTSTLVFNFIGTKLLKSSSFHLLDKILEVLEESLSLCVCLLFIKGQKYEWTVKGFQSVFSFRYKIDLKVKVVKNVILGRGKGAILNKIIRRTQCTISDLFLF